MEISYPNNSHVALSICFEESSARIGAAGVRASVRESIITTKSDRVPARNQPASFFLFLPLSLSLSVSSYRRRWIRCTNHRPTAFHNWIMLSSFSFFLLLLLLFLLLFSALCKRKNNGKQEVYYIFINLRITIFFF